MKLALAADADAAFDSENDGQIHQHLSCRWAGYLVRHSGHDVNDELDYLPRYDQQALLCGSMEVSGIQTHIVCLDLNAAPLYYYFQILLADSASAAVAACIQNLYGVHTAGSFEVDGCGAVVA